MNVITISAEAEQAKEIAEQNDSFRRTWGADFTIPGRILATKGLVAFGTAFMQRTMVAVMQHSSFDEDNDPFDQHDFGIVTIPHAGETHKVYWKIDLYDRACIYGSESPADPTMTCRVMTLLLPSEY